jgi:hypothetical protein
MSLRLAGIPHWFCLYGSPFRAGATLLPSFSAGLGERTVDFDQGRRKGGNQEEAEFLYEGRRELHDAGILKERLIIARIVIEVARRLDLQRLAVEASRKRYLARYRVARRLSRRAKLAGFRIAPFDDSASMPEPLLMSRRVVLSEVGNRSDYADLLSRREGRPEEIMLGERTRRSRPSRADNASTTVVFPELFAPTRTVNSPNDS